jgi:hypothetical protein
MQDWIFVGAIVNVSHWPVTDSQKIPLIHASNEQDFSWAALVVVAVLALLFCRHLSWRFVTNQS